MKSSEVTPKGYSVFDGTMADMTYLQIEKAAEERLPILIPVGVIEEHGPHLPLGVDVYGAYVIAKTVRANLENKGVQALIAPPFFWGMNHCTGSFAGSFTVREETMISLFWDIMASLRRWGFERVFIINHHYDRDHTRVLNKAIQKARLDTGIGVYWPLDDFMAKNIGFTGSEPYLLIYKAPPRPSSNFIEIHAERYETSFMLHYFPNLVDGDVLKSLKSTDLTVQDLKVWMRGWEEARRITPQGFFGDPGAASAEYGRRAVEEFGETAADLIGTFLRGEYQPPEMK